MAIAYNGVDTNDAIVELCNDDKATVSHAFLITKRLDDFGKTRHDTKIPILKLPAIVFLYILGKSESEGQGGKL